ncbi:hypothetical protein ACM40_13610 [Chryseobacterium sp. BLS98]|uniref:hypothetical protein n=1 Tax=Chryseobacterium sp. BLS98 TaxID=885586 RepID=UPI00065AB6C4|nr:hypothetical protein [Chryseobacterium sp. BLS98]KMQ60772.1 hypothetical protein ACM40_13610 [Chryseobacterium sp. BLS98]
MKSLNSFFLVTCFLFWCTKYFAQVGINTSNPQGIFHLDGAKDNPSSGAVPPAQQLNDFIVSANGTVGIGNLTSTSKLTIDSGAGNQSGMKFTNLTSSSPSYNGATSNIAVKQDGVVVSTSSTLCVPGFYYTNGSTGNNNTPIGSNVILNSNTEAQEIIQNSSGDFRLKKGNTYRLEAALFTANANSSYLEYQWYSKKGDGTYLKIPSQNLAHSGQTLNSGGHQAMTLAYYTPTSDMDVSLKITAKSSPNISFWNPHSYLFIQQINSCK